MSYKLVPTKLGRKMIKKINERRAERGNRHMSSMLMDSDSNIKRRRAIIETPSKVKETPESLAKQLEKAYKQNMPKQESKRFQHPDGLSMTIYDESNKEIFRVKGPVPRKDVKRIIKKHPKASILVEVGPGVFKQIPLKTFKELTKIKFMVFQREYEFFGVDDFEPISKSGDWYAPDAVINYVYSMNHLLGLFIIEEAFDHANDVFLSARFYDLTGSDKVCKILYANGQVESVKYKKFLERLGLNMGIGNYMGKSKKKG